MSEAQLQRFIDAMPWPWPDAKPVLKYGETDTGFHLVLLHDNIRLGWRDVSEVRAYTPERALYHALVEWCAKKGLDHHDDLWAALKRLSN